MRVYEKPVIDRPIKFGTVQSGMVITLLSDTLEEDEIYLVLGGTGQTPYNAVNIKTGIVSVINNSARVKVHPYAACILKFSE